VEGLGALVQRQGARAVIATLWPVADASTGILMQRFYRARQETDGKNKAEALRQAQLLLLRGSADAVEPRRPSLGSGDMPVPRSSRYSHPFFWAPFILMGNWL
jgi:CHAT domain-containing protein